MIYNNYCSFLIFTVTKILNTVVVPMHRIKKHKTNYFIYSKAVAKDIRNCIYSQTGASLERTDVFRNPVRLANCRKQKLCKDGPSQSC